MKDRITNASSVLGKKAWTCSHCSVGKLLSSNAQVKETNIRNANASSIFVVPKSGNLKDHHFNLIVIPNGCLNDDIIHLKIKKIDPTLQGFTGCSIELTRQFIFNSRNEVCKQTICRNAKRDTGCRETRPMWLHRSNSIVGLTQMEFVEFCSNAELPMCRIKWVDLFPKECFFNSEARIE